MPEGMGIIPIPPLGLDRPVKVKGRRRSTPSGVEEEHGHLTYDIDGRDHLLTSARRLSHSRSSLLAR